jgi:hypothetical protein
MSIRRCLILGCMVVGLQVLSAGQDQPSQNPPAQNPGGDNSDSGRTAPAAALSAIAGMQPEGGTEDTNEDLPQIPALLGGKGTSTAFLPEMERSNYLRGGVNVGATYDDNPLLLSNGESNTSETIFPNIRIEESTSRMRWSLGYAGGLTVNQKITSQNQGSHNLSFDSQFRLSPHVNLRVAESFFMTTGFFDAGNGGAAVAGSGGPNASLITPLATQRSSVTTVEANYHYALNDLVGASGSFYDLHFSNVPTPPAGTQPTELTDSQTASGSAFWLHRLFRGDWGGVSYRFDRITFNPNGETRVHSFTVVDTLSVSKRFTLTGFIGPQYSENQGLVAGATQPSQSNDWSVSGGAEGGWQGERTSLSAGYSRSISDGGGVLGAVHLQTVRGNFRQVIVPGWAVALTASHGTNESITVPFTTSASSVNLTSAGISLERNVEKSFGLRFAYTHDFQEQFGLPAPMPTQDASRNRFVVTLSYQWAKPLGM